MQPRALSGSSGLAGRTAERALLRDLLGSVSDGRPVIAVVHGEAGVGKTSLVSEVCREAEKTGVQVLWGRCLLLGSVSMPYLPLVTAFEGWLEGSPPEDRQALLEAAPDLVRLVPSLGGEPGEAAGHLASIHRALSVLAARRPLLLVVDDVQWADSTSRDVLSYVVSGLRGAIGVVFTARDEDVPEGDPLHGWLADVRRLPGAVDLPLARLTLEETGEQASLLLGTEVDVGLVGELFARTGGNAYFNDLLLREVDPAAARLPTSAPEALRGALLAAWHRMSPGARETCRLLAVAGRPTTAHALADAGEGLGLPRASSLAVIREAVEHGVVEAGSRIWFRHPLLAEVLRDTLLTDELIACHRCLVEVLRTDPDASHGDLARHFEGAGLADEAFAEYLVAAREAERLAAFSEAAAQSLAAWRLREQVSSAVLSDHGSLVALATRVAFAVRRGGWYAEAALVLDEARARLADESESDTESDPEPDPVLRARLLRLWAQLSQARGATEGADESMDALRAALAEAQRAPGCAEHAHVLAELAYGHVVRGESAEALARSAEAVTLARDTGDPFVLSYALGIDASAHQAIGDLAHAEERTEEAQAVAISSERPEAVGLAAIARANVLDATGRWTECVDVLLDTHRRAHEGDVLGLAHQLGAFAAHFLGHVGRFQEADEVLRQVLSVGVGGAVERYARLAAVALAVREGRIALAEMHLARLRDVDPDFASGEAPAPTVWAEYAVATSRAEEALDLLELQVAGRAVRAEIHYGDELLVWAARAAGAIEDPGAGVRRLEAIVRRRAELEPAAFAGTDHNPVRAAWKALFDAESAGVRGAADRADLWRSAVTRTEAAELRFEHARSLLELGRCLAGESGRAEMAARLRDARAIADEIGAGGLVEKIVSFARMARVPLGEPSPVASGSASATSGSASGSASALDRAGLTRREREVLSHLVVGRTYAEIAAALFISEKTVSVHVSNVLRKTGTTNRVDAAAWAERVGSDLRPSAAPR